MRPTLKEGDKLFVSKFIYGARIPFAKIRLPKVKEPQRGDIIVFQYPRNPKRDFIKRLIGKEGDRVKIEKGKIYLNGKPLDIPAISEFHYYNMGPYGEDEILVPQGHYYVLGDNSQVSKDSRDWGFLPQENLIGKAFFIFWPPHRIGILR